MLLANIQAAMRQAIIAGDVSGVVSLLAGGRDATRRLAIHQRHYEASLTRAILGKFPATEWLVGSSFLTEAAQRYVRAHPPQAPCIAEYGASFPQFISGCPGTDRLPYLRDFAELEWRVGQASIALDLPPVALEHLSTIPAERLPETGLILQPGLYYQRASWPVDELMKLYLTETAPDRFAFDPADVWLEIRGARGEFQINRLDPAECIFRKSLLQRQALASAAEAALAEDPSFDAGKALLALVAHNLAVGVGEVVHGDLQ